MIIGKNIKFIDALSKYIDQFFFVMVNFGSVLILSKILDAEIVSGYILAVTMASFIVYVSSALIVVPLQLLSSNMEYRVRELFTVNYLLVILLSVVFGALVYLFFFIRRPDLAIGAFFLSVSFCLYDFCRRSLYVWRLEKYSAISSVFVFLIASVIVSSLFFENSLSEGILVISIGIAFLIGAGFLFYISISKRFFEIPSWEVSRNIVNKQLRMGQWSLLSMMLFWLSSQGFFVYSEGVVNDEVYVASRVCLSISGLIGFFFVAIENNKLPELSAVVNSGRIEALKELRSRFLNTSLFYFSVSSLLSMVVFALLYEQYHEYYLLMVACVFYQSFLTFSVFQNFMAKVLIRQKRIFLINVVSFCISWLSYFIAVRIDPDYAIAVGLVSYAFMSFVLFTYSSVSKL